MYNNALQCPYICCEGDILTLFECTHMCDTFRRVLSTSFNTTVHPFLPGFFFGRTRLIKLSPKKTWEGFLGAFVSTVLFGFIVSIVYHCIVR